MTTRNTPTFIEDPGEVSIKIEGLTIELGTLLWGPAMNLTPGAARWLAKELEMRAADVDRKSARAMMANIEQVMETKR